MTRKKWSQRRKFWAAYLRDHYPETVPAAMFKEQNFDQKEGVSPESHISDPSGWSRPANLEYENDSLTRSAANMELAERDQNRSLFPSRIRKFADLAIVTTNQNTSAPSVVRFAEAIRRILGYQFPALGGLVYQAFFRILPNEIDVELLPGIRARLNTRDGTQRATYWQGARFEHPTGVILKQWVSGAGAKFFDIGSNYGWYSLYLAGIFPEMEIYAFEPNPPTFRRLSDIANRNNLQNLHPCNLGLGDHPMTCHLRINSEDSGRSSFGNIPNLAGTNSVAISVQPFDKWRREVGLELPSTPTWVAKIDVEGFECRVIDGMREALTAKAFRGLAVEVNCDTLELCGDSPAKLIALLDSFDYVERQPQFPDEQRQMNKFFVPRR